MLALQDRRHLVPGPRSKKTPVTQVASIKIMFRRIQPIIQVSNDRLARSLGRVAKLKTCCKAAQHGATQGCVYVCVMKLHMAGTASAHQSNLFPMGKKQCGSNSDNASAK